MCEVARLLPPDQISQPETVGPCHILLQACELSSNIFEIGFRVPSHLLVSGSNWLSYGFFWEIIRLSIGDSVSPSFFVCVESIFPLVGVVSLYVSLLGTWFGNLPHGPCVDCGWYIFDIIRISQSMPTAPLDNSPSASCPTPSKRRWM